MKEELATKDQSEHDTDSTAIKNIETIVKETVHKDMLDIDMLETLSQQVKTKINMDAEGTQASGDDQKIEKKIAEIWEWENNIVFYNIKESTSEDMSVRKREDQEFVKELCNLLRTDPGDIVTTTGPGRRETNTEGILRDRPLKVIFIREKPKNSMLRNNRELQSAET